MSLEKLFGTALRKRRKQSNISQEKLAELCDLDRTYISLLERGIRQPTLSTIFRLANALGISPSNFVADVENEINENH